MDNSGGKFLAMLLVTAIAMPIAFALSKRKSNRLKSEGKIIDRKSDFANYTEVFLLKDIPFAEMCNVIVNSEYYDAADVIGDVSLQYILFKGDK